MKSLALILFCLLFSYTGLTQSDDERTILPNKTWAMESNYHVLGSGGQEDITTTYSYLISETTTLIDGKEYSSLHHIDQNSDTIYNYQYLREEGGIIYCFKNQEESSIIDFNLEVGEILGSNDLVIDIDSINLLDGSVSKRLHISLQQNPNWITFLIEGVTLNITPPNTLGSGFEWIGDRILCVSNEDALLYSVNGEVCGFTSSVAKTQSASNTIIYPNPVHNSFSVLNLSERAQGNILNLQGEITIKVNVAEHIDISELAPGIYFLQILDKVNSVIKFVKL